MLDTGSAVGKISAIRYAHNQLYYNQSTNRQPMKGSSQNVQVSPDGAGVLKQVKQLGFGNVPPSTLSRKRELQALAAYQHAAGFYLHMPARGLLFDRIF
jgi:hypothetical protein